MPGVSPLHVAEVPDPEQDAEVQVAPQSVEDWKPQLLKVEPAALQKNVRKKMNTEEIF